MTMQKHHQLFIKIEVKFIAILYVLLLDFIFIYLFTFLSDLFINIYLSAFCSINNFLEYVIIKHFHTHFAKIVIEKNEHKT